MTENELCQQLVDALFLRCNDDDSWSQTAREKLLPIIRSYINSLASPNETQLRRDILIAVNKLAPPTFANDISVPIESVIDSVLPLIRSYATAIANEERGISEILRAAGDELIKENKELRQQNAALVSALRWTRDYIQDGLETPSHNCEYFSNPEKGSCDFCEKWADVQAALAPYAPAEEKEKCDG